MTHPHTAIVGAGIIGATLAHALAKRGAPVTVIDEGVMENRATAGSFAWINAHRPEDAHYFDLRLHSMRLWREMAAEDGDLPVRLSGALNWEVPEDEIEELARALDEGGNTARLVPRARIRDMEPALASPPEVAIDAPLEGVANPDAIAQALLAAAVRMGARILGARVTGIATVNGCVTGLETDAGPVDAERVVVAAGRATPALLGMVDFALPMKTPLGLLVRTKPVPRLSRRIMTNPDLHVWQMADGRLIMGEDFGGSEVGDRRADTEARALDRARATFAGVPLEFETSTVAGRPVPEDGYPAVGWVPGIDGLMAATMHSGITLAPVMAAHLSAMLLDDAAVGVLEPYRVGRFAAA
jgi:glycine/D-amino acid oxidase-like deaminating enzyme